MISFHVQDTAPKAIMDGHDQSGRNPTLSLSSGLLPSAQEFDLICLTLHTKALAGLQQNCLPPVGNFAPPRE